MICDNLYVSYNGVDMVIEIFGNFNNDLYDHYHYVWLVVYNTIESVLDLNDVEYDDEESIKLDLYSTRFNNGEMIFNASVDVIEAFKDSEIILLFEEEFLSQLLDEDLRNLFAVNVTNVNITKEKHYVWRTEKPTTTTVTTTTSISTTIITTSAAETTMESVESTQSSTSGVTTSTTASGSIGKETTDTPSSGSGQSNSDFSLSGTTLIFGKLSCILL